MAIGLDSPTVFPLTFALDLVAAKVLPFPMLLPVQPLSIVFRAVRPLHETVAIPLVTFILADVLPAISPEISAQANHLIIQPFAIELPTVGPLILSFALERVQNDPTFIRLVILPLKEPLPVLLSVPEIPGIL